MAHNEEQTQHIVNILAAQVAAGFAAGKSRAQVIDELQRDGASAEVATALVLAVEKIQQPGAVPEPPEIAALPSAPEASPGVETSDSAAGGWSLRSMIKNVIG